MDQSNTTSPPVPTRGSYVSEWYGHRVYPQVSDAAQSLADQREARCPFLSTMTRATTACIKPDNSQGICTISSPSNGPRQDWLACPYRALDDSLLVSVVRRLFRAEDDAEIVMLAAPVLTDERKRRGLVEHVRNGGLAIVYLQNRLGGEITLPSTPRSPEFSFDSTMVEIVAKDGGFDVGRYGILEVQTMDFHGSYKAALGNLRDALRLHGDRFAEVLQANLAWTGERVEGPNIANVFKRTFYQMMFKFQVGAHEHCAGTIFAVPKAVWDSWQRHLGRPELAQREDGTYSLLRETGEAIEGAAPAWIYVFDIDTATGESPNPIVIDSIIATDADAMSHYALEVAPNAALEAGGSADRLLASIRTRIGRWWPGLGVPTP